MKRPVRAGQGQLGSTGLKILVSAVQSRPCPPFLSGSCLASNFFPSLDCDQSVTISGSLQLTRAHFDGVLDGHLVHAYTPVKSHI